MKTTTIKLNGKEGVYTTTVDLYQYLGLDVDYEEFRLSLLNYACKSSIYSYYKEGELNPKKYQFRANNDWYEAKKILEILPKK